MKSELKPAALSDPQETERAALEWVRGLATQWEAIGLARRMANLTGTDDLNYSNSAAHLRVVLRMAEGSSEGPPSHEVGSTNHDQ